MARGHSTKKRQMMMVQRQKKRVGRMNKHICRSTTDQTTAVIFIFFFLCVANHYTAWQVATYFYLSLNPINPKVSLVFVGLKVYKWRFATTTACKNRIKNQSLMCLFNIQSESRTMQRNHSKIYSVNPFKCFDVFI